MGVHLGDVWLSSLSRVTVPPLEELPGLDTGCITIHSVRRSRQDHWSSSSSSKQHRMAVKSVRCRLSLADMVVVFPRRSRFNIRYRAAFEGNHTPRLESTTEIAPDDLEPREDTALAPEMVHCGSRAVTTDGEVKGVAVQLGIWDSSLSRDGDRGRLQRSSSPRQTVAKRASHAWPRVDAGLQTLDIGGVSGGIAVLVSGASAGWERAPAVVALEDHDDQMRLFNAASCGGLVWFGCDGWADKRERGATMHVEGGATV
ncbi:hypothetical protein LZ30DRAFT_703726 [Colletotrichum cereale]|nr:hypothetical protein LZ30DRAFT_703726 [Colletotrichum cereale]